MMELSQIITLIIFGGFTVFLIIMGVSAYRESVITKKSRKESTLNMLLFEVFALNNCASKPNDDFGIQVKYIEPYFNDDINSDFTERECGSYD